MYFGYVYIVGVKSVFCSIKSVWKGELQECVCCNIGLRFPVDMLWSDCEIHIGTLSMVVHYKKLEIFVL